MVEIRCNPAVLATTPYGISFRRNVFRLLYVGGPFRPHPCTRISTSCWCFQPSKLRS